MRTIEIPIKSRLHKSIVVCAYDGIFYNNESEQTRAKYNKLDVSYKRDVAWEKLDTKDFILYDVIYIKCKTSKTILCF